MKPITISFCSALLLLTWTAARANPTADALGAAMALAEQPNYGWVTQVQDDAGEYEITGAYEQNGYARVQMPRPPALKLRLPEANTIVAVFREPDLCVISTTNGWKKPSELPWPETRTSTDRESKPLRDFGARPDFGRVGGSMTEEEPGRMRFPRTPPKPPPDPYAGPYSNLQLSICPPHLELGTIVSCHRDFVVHGGTVTGSLNELGAKLLLYHDGEKAVTPLRATGAFTLWIENGAVVKYEVQLQGVLRVKGLYRKRDIPVKQTMVTHVHNVGATTVDAPDEAIEALRR